MPQSLKIFEQSQYIVELIFIFADKFNFFKIQIFQLDHFFDKNGINRLHKIDINKRKNFQTS